MSGDVESAVRSIRCGRCGRIVDRVTVEMNDRVQGWTIAVQCHGETETMVLNDFILDELGPYSAKITEAIAFNAPAAIEQRST